MLKNLQQHIQIVEGYQTIAYDQVIKKLNEFQIDNLNEFLTGKTMTLDPNDNKSTLLFFKDVEKFFAQYGIKDKSQITPGYTGSYYE